MTVPVSHDIQHVSDPTGLPLEEILWIVVDLETTGLGASDSITEIGAVMAHNGHLIDEFHTLVNPGVPLSPRVTAITGITDAMLRNAPPITDAYPAFARWAGLLAHRVENAATLFSSSVPLPHDRLQSFRGPVLVAHNVTFDEGFLQRAARTSGYVWPSLPTVDTLALSRFLLPFPVVHDHRLGTVATHLSTSSHARHRALADAHTTREVFEALIELVKPLGVLSLEGLAALSPSSL